MKNGLQEQKLKDNHSVTQNATTSNGMYLGPVVNEVPNLMTRLFLPSMLILEFV
jgi:hypothetical protein